MAFDMPAEQLDQTLNAIPGIVEHGLFIGLVSTVLIADDYDVSTMVKS